VREGSVWITMMPLFHTGGCVVCILGALARRTTNVLVEMFEPGLVIELLETYKVNALLGVPTMLIAILEHPDFEKRDLSSIETMTSGGSTVPAPLVQRFEEGLGAKFTIVFGQTECSPVACMTRPDDSTEDKGNTLGLPMPNVEVKIVDPDTGDTVKPGELGEFCTRGYHVMHEYYRNPEATAAAIDADGWLHTGDLCSMDERGYSSVQGRLKDMIIRGGENIYPRELEDLLFKHPSVGEIAVVGLPDDKWGEIVGAFVRAAPDATPTKEELFVFCREHLSPQKTPSEWVFVDAFPLTASGKIQKFVLREMWQKGEFTRR
jgi:fatty-acyl-CoA synthase